MSPRKWLKTIALVAVPFVLLLVAGKPVLRSYLLAHPPERIVELDEAQAGDPVERVTFASTDGIELAGWFVSATDPARGGGATIVASHGSHATGPDHYPGIAFLRDAGYNLFVFDHRAHGQSGGEFTTLGPLEVRDLRGAVAYLAARPDVDPDKIGAIGCSMGAAIVIAGAAEDASIRAVVAEGIYADMDELWTRFGYRGLRVPSGHPLAWVHWSWGGLMRAATWLWTGYPVWTFKPVEVVGGISPRPVLLIHGEHDNGATTVADALRLYEAAGEPKELWIVPGAGHSNAHVLVSEEYEERVRGFFDEVLLD
jgi:alpha-beta hydrolase superfamily lysophospholipase